MRACLVSLALMSLAGCATTSSSRDAELSYCQKMEQEMGTAHVHDHAEEKGMGLNPMNVTHARCRSMLGIK